MLNTRPRHRFGYKTTHAISPVALAEFTMWCKSFATMGGLLFILGAPLRCILLAALVSQSTYGNADERVFRIGTGGSAGTYLPIGTLLAEALNRYDEQDDSGEPRALNLLVLPQRSNGSATNVQEIEEGLLESGLMQADVAHWAYRGTGPFEGSDTRTNIRAIATLYLESLHLVATIDSGIHSIADLVGQRVSVDEIGSGTHLDVTPVLQAHGLSSKDVKIVYLKPADAIDRLRQQQLDAFFIVAGFPIQGVSELVQEGKARIVPITEEKLSALLDTEPFFTTDTFPIDTYGNASVVPTLAVAAQWVVDAAIDEELVYRITRALWSQQTSTILAQGHPKGREVSIDSALVGLGIPLHPGAARYYRELGIKTPDLALP